MERLPEHLRDRIINILLSEGSFFRGNAKMPQELEDWNQKAQEERWSKRLIYPSQANFRPIDPECIPFVKKLTIMGLSQKAKEEAAGYQGIHPHIIECFEQGWSNVTSIDMMFPTRIKAVPLASAIHRYFPNLKSLRVRLSIAGLPKLLKAIDTLNLHITSLSVKVNPVDMNEEIYINSIKKIYDVLPEIAGRLAAFKINGCAIPLTLVQRITQTQPNLEALKFSCKSGKIRVGYPLFQLTSLRIVDVDGGADLDPLVLESKDFPSLESLHLENITAHQAQRLGKDQILENFLVGKWVHLIGLYLPYINDHISEKIATLCPSLAVLEVKPSHKASEIQIEQNQNPDNSITNDGFLILVNSLQFLRRLVFKNSINYSVHSLKKESIVSKMHSQGAWKCMDLEQLTIDTWDLDLKEAGIICKNLARMKTLEIIIDSDKEDSMKTVEMFWPKEHQSLYKVRIIYYGEHINYSMLDTLIKRLPGLKHIEFAKRPNFYLLPAEFTELYPKISFSSTF